jgi:hypothetical protein
LAADSTVSPVAAAMSLCELSPSFQSRRASARFSASFTGAVMGLALLGQRALPVALRLARGAPNALLRLDFHRIEIPAFVSVRRFSNVLIANDLHRFA